MSSQVLFIIHLHTKTTQICLEITALKMLRYFKVSYYGKDATVLLWRLFQWFCLFMQSWTLTPSAVSESCFQEAVCMPFSLKNKTDVNYSVQQTTTIQNVSSPAYLFLIFVTIICKTTINYKLLFACWPKYIHQFTTTTYTSIKWPGYLHEGNNSRAHRWCSKRFLNTVADY